MDQPRSGKAETIAEECRAMGIEERDSFIRESCGADEKLRTRVHDLLAMDHTVDVQADSASGTSHEQSASHSSRARVPEKIGRYFVRRQIGEGGMGAVYEALQENPKRRVAIKVLRSSMASEAATKRFEYESQVLARLKHPGIAEVYEAGTYDVGDGPMPFFAMEYISGRKEIDEYVRAKKLDVREKIRLFSEICEALHHGHQKGVVHRDLKPGNLLVDSDGRPRIIDFGVARATDSDMAMATMQTEVGQLIGTVQYMSPEQCEGDPDLVDVRSDIYALGVILFELMTGARPHDLAGSTIYEAVRTIREDSPTRMGTVNRSFRGDLETIVGKALEKDPDRRYQSALELKQDLDRFLANEPIEARPPSMRYHARMFAKRHKGIAASIVVVAMVLVVTTAWSLVERGRASEAALSAMNAESLAKEAAEKARIAEAGAMEDRDMAQAAEAATASALQRVESEQIRTMQAMDFLTGVFELANPANTQGRKLTMPDMLREASEQLGEAFADQPIMAVELRDKLGTIQIDLGDMDGAESNLLKGLILAERVHGTSSVEALSIGVKLAGVMVEQGRLAEGRSRLDSILEQTDMVGEDAREVDILARGWVVKILGNQLNMAEAEALGRVVVEDSRTLFGPDHENTIRYEVELAQFQDSNFRLSGEPIPVDHTPAYGDVDRVRSLLGELHPVTIYAKLSEVLRYFSTPNEPEDIDRQFEVLAGECRLVLGDRHPRTLEVLQVMGINDLTNGEYEKAIPVLSEVHEGYLEIYSPEHPQAQYAATILGTTLLNLKRVDEALPYLAASWRGQEKLWGESDIRTVQALSNYSIALMMADRFDEAEPLFKRAIDLQRAFPNNMMGEGVLRMFFSKAKQQVELGRIDDGFATVKDLLREGREGDGLQNYTRYIYGVEALKMFAESDDRTRSLAIAEELASGVAESLVDVPDEQLKAITFIAQALNDQGMYEETTIALKTFPDLENLIDADGVKPDSAIRSMVEVGRALGPMGEAARSVELLENAIERMEGTDEATSRRLAYVRIILAPMLLEVGRGDESLAMAMNVLPDLSEVENSKPGVTSEFMIWLLSGAIVLDDAQLVTVARHGADLEDPGQRLDRLIFLVEQIPADRLEVVRPTLEEASSLLSGDQVDAAVGRFEAAWEEAKDPARKAVYKALVGRIQ